MDIFELEQKQLKEIFDDIANYIPILKRVLTKSNDTSPTMMKKYILMEKQEGEKNKKKDIKMFSLR